MPRAVPDPVGTARSATAASADQTSMVHVLPPAPLVDRVDHLCALARGRRVIHVGFADQGYRSMQERSGAWLHAHLDRAASSLVGLDLSPTDVAAAAADGYEVHAVDCTDPVAVAELGLAPAQVVLAGEVIEHLDAPGGLFEALAPLVAPGGLLVVTTPNGYGWLNVAASLLHREINHPDHVAMFTQRTLTALGHRHGWSHEATAVYVPSVKGVAGRGLRARLMALAARATCAAERVACRLGRPYAADGLIVAFRRAGG